jgi:CHASE3 domain sensor protein
LAYLLVAVAVVTVASLSAFEIQRQSAVRAWATTQIAASALTAIPDQEPGSRGYQFTGSK